MTEKKRNLQPKTKDIKWKLYGFKSIRRSLIPRLFLLPSCVDDDDDDDDDDSLNYIASKLDYYRELLCTQNQDLFTMVIIFFLLQPKF